MSHLTEKDTLKVKEPTEATMTQVAGEDDDIDQNGARSYEKEQNSTKGDQEID